MKLSVLTVIVIVFFFFPGQSQGNGQEERFPGQKALSVLLRATGGFEGKIFLQDNLSSGLGHDERMFDTLAQSVPKEHILTFEGVEGSIHRTEKIKSGWASVDHAEEMKKHGVRVIHVPTLWHHNTSHSRREGALQVLKSQDILAVYAAGNFNTIPLDVYHPESSYWGNAPPWNENGSRLPEYWVIEEFFQEGYAVMANFAIRKPETLEELVQWARYQRDERDLREMYQAAEGEYIRHPLTARFGALKEYGFSVSLKEKSIPWNRGGRFVPGTSDASAHVAAFAFYLYQLWDTAKEVVEVMQQTATDIGEPGVDEEFGWGLINAHHPLIWNRAVQRLEESLEVHLFADVTLEQAITVAEDNLDVFHHIGEDKREIGLTFGTHKTTVACAAGSTASPFGVSSRFLQQRNAAAQIGVRYSFTDTFSITGIYGRSKHEDFDVNKGSIGVDYQKHFLGDTGELSVYAGHRSIWGSLGIPGYDALDIPQTPFTLRIVEARASFALHF